MSKNICQKSIVSLLENHIGIESTINIMDAMIQKNR